jgi:hypothetical protein
MDHNPDTTTGLREELRSDAGRVADAAADRLESEADSRKSGAASQAKGLSSALDTAARELGDDSPHWLRSALQQGSRSLEQLAQSVEQKDARALLAEVQRMARERPGTFLAGCAAIGFAAARVLKAGASDTGSTSARPGASNPAHEPYDPYAAGTGGGARPMMAFSDGGGSASPVSQTMGTSL